MNNSNKNIGIPKTITVLDEKNNPLPFAEVFVLGQFNISHGAITNLDGKTTITALPNDTIGISHLSYIDEQYQFKDLPNTVKMEIDLNQLNEVTIISNPKKTNWVKPLAIGAVVMFAWFKLRGKPKGLNAPLQVTL